MKERRDSITDQRTDWKPFRHWLRFIPGSSPHPSKSRSRKPHPLGIRVSFIRVRLRFVLQLLLLLIFATSLARPGVREQQSKLSLLVKKAINHPDFIVCPAKHSLWGSLGNKRQLSVLVGWCCCCCSYCCCLSGRTTVTSFLTQEKRQRQQKPTEFLILCWNIVMIIGINCFAVAIHSQASALVALLLTVLCWLLITALFFSCSSYSM